MEHTFDTLCDAILYVFRQEETSLLALDKICNLLENPNFYINSKTSGLVPTSTITRRRISSTLSSSDLFVRAGPPRTCLWAIRPNNPSFISDGAIAASIEQMLTTHGPMTTQQFVDTTDLSGAHLTLFERYLSEHTDEFSQNEEGYWWFVNQPMPIRREFDNLVHALLAAFDPFPEGASVEEIHWYLCLATVGGKPITRRSISRELSRRQDLFLHLSRAKYGLLPCRKPYVPQPPPQYSGFIPPPPPPPPQRTPMPIPQLNTFNPFEPKSPEITFDDPSTIPEYHDDDFDPDAFFGSDFNFQL